MEYTTTAEVKPEYQPNARQIERDASLRRFNRLFVYLPILITALIGLVVIGLLFWVTIIQPGETSRETVSGIASAVVILVSLPMTLLCAIPSVLIIVLTVQGRQKGTAPIKRIQTLFWRLDTLVLRIQSAVNQNVQKPADVVIKGHAIAAYVRTLSNKIINLLKRS